MFSISNKGYFNAQGPLLPNIQHTKIYQSSIISNFQGQHRPRDWRQRFRWVTPEYPCRCPHRRLRQQRGHLCLRWAFQLERYLHMLYPSKEFAPDFPNDAKDLSKVPMQKGAELPKKMGRLVTRALSIASRMLLRDVKSTLYNSWIGVVKSSGSSWRSRSA